MAKSLTDDEEWRNFIELLSLDVHEITFKG